MDQPMAPLLQSAYLLSAHSPPSRPCAVWIQHTPHSHRRQRHASGTFADLPPPTQPQSASMSAPSAAAASSAAPAAPAAAPLRIYVHSVPSASYSAWPEHTWVVSCAGGAAAPTVRKLKTLFKEELHRRFFSKELVKLPVMTAGVMRRGKPTTGTELRDDQSVADVLQDRDDVFFELKPPTAPAPAAAAAPKPAESAPSSSSSAASGSAPFDRNASQPLGPAEQLMYQQLTFARDLQSRGQLKKARDLYVQLLAAVPADNSRNTSAAGEHAQSARQICHQQLGVIYLFNRQYEQARPHLEAAVKIVTSGHSAANEAIVKSIGRAPQPELAQLIALVGQCYFGVSDFSDAQTHFERALKLLTPKGEESQEPAIQAAIKDTKVWLARAMYRGSASERSQALSLFESIIAQDEHHVGALTHYARVAIECGKKAETLPYLIRALVASQAAGSAPAKGSASYEQQLVGGRPRPAPGSELDPQLVELVQVLLTDLVLLPDGVKLLLSELHAAANNQAAITFLAQTIKDQGGVVPAIALYKHALKACDLDAKGRGSVLLSLVHTMEVEYQYNEAFALIKQHLRENADTKAGSLRLGDFYAAIANITDLYDVRLRTGDAPGVPAYCEIGPIWDEGTCHVTIPQPGAPPPKKSTAVPYPPDELQLIALMFTAVKMLYVCGGLQVLPTLINLLEPLRVERDLHLTLIRNEHAYASSIHQMMRWLPFPIPREAAAAATEDTIFVVGDSHCMSAAWQTVRLDLHPRPMLLVPKLVTGLKAWHLRPSCRFYPKRNFEAAMRSLPSGAQVIFNVGEIDAREGLLLAVEKGRYESLDQAAAVAVDVYAKAVQQYAAEKQLRAYIHPITPVLDVTRPTVKIFEAKLRERINATAGAGAAGGSGGDKKGSGGGSSSGSDGPALTYLDFFSALLTPDGSGFNMSYHLDSTHLKPTYVGAALRPALNAVYVPRRGLVAADTSAMSTMDAINHRLLRAQMGDFGDEDEDSEATA